MNDAETFESVSKNKKTKFHLLITYLMIIVGLVPVVWLLYNYPTYFVGLPLTFSTIFLVFLPFIFQIFIIIAAIGIRNFKKWGLWSGLISSVVIILFSIYNVWFISGSLATATTGFLGTFKIPSPTFIFSNLIAYLAAIGPIFSLIFSLIIFAYLLQKRTIFK